VEHLPGERRRVTQIDFERERVAPAFEVLVELRCAASTSGAERSTRAP
jgi:hypothetical protein